MNPHIEIDPRRCNGKPVVAGTRIPVTVILDQLADSGSVETVLKKYPELTRDSVAVILRPRGARGVRTAAPSHPAHTR